MSITIDLPEDLEHRLALTLGAPDPSQAKTLALLGLASALLQNEPSTPVRQAIQHYFEERSLNFEQEARLIKQRMLAAVLHDLGKESIEFKNVVEDSSVNGEESHDPGPCKRGLSFGMFANLPGGSVDFAECKQAEIDWEDRNFP